MTGNYIRYGPDDGENFFAPAPVNPPFIQAPASFPAVPVTLRSASASVMIDNDATVAMVGYANDVLPYLTRGQERIDVTATGAARRERGDHHDPVTAELLAVARAYHKLSMRLFRRANSRVRTADAIQRHHAAMSTPEAKRRRREYEERKNVRRTLEQAAAGDPVVMTAGAAQSPGPGQTVRKDGLLTMAGFGRREGIKVVSARGSYRYSQELRDRYDEYLKLGLQMQANNRDKRGNGNDGNAGDPRLTTRKDGLLTMAGFGRREGINFMTSNGQYSYPPELRKKYAEYLERETSK